MARPTTRTAKRAPNAGSTRARKNMDIDVAKLARARALLGTATDTETVDQALDLVDFRHEHATALERLAAAGGLVDVFGRTAALPAAASGGDEPGGRAVRRTSGGTRAAAARQREGAAGRARS